MDQQQFTRAQMRWIWLGLFQSIRPQINCQPGKANLVVDALSHSELDTQAKMDEPEIGTQVDEEMVNALLRGSQLQSAEVDEWRKSQLEDPALQEILNRATEGQEAKYKISHQGLLYRQQNDR